VNKTPLTLTAGRKAGVSDGEANLMLRGRASAIVAWRSAAAL
jgi:hypothetical protein